MLNDKLIEALRDSQRVISIRIDELYNSLYEQGDDKVETELDNTIDLANEIHALIYCLNKSKISGKPAENVYISMRTIKPWPRRQGGAELG